MSLKECTDDDIETIEKFLRDKWRKIMEKKRSDGKVSDIQMIDYFSEHHAENPKEFEFRPGDKKLIKALAAHVRHVVNDNIEEGLKHFKNNSCDDVDFHVCAEKGNSTAHNSENIVPSQYLLDQLQSAADRNSSRKPGGYRYDSTIKLFATYLRLIAGRLAYETIQRNLECSLPSLSSVNRYIRNSSYHIIEGVARYDELVTYLNERNLPHIVSLSEDATRIVGKVQYCAKTNQIVGFVLPKNDSNGMPTPFAYSARNAAEIIKHFTFENTESTFLNVIMAQPAADVSAFCLLAYGSDNKYTANDVSQRWSHITTELGIRNILVLSIGSDSDPRYNTAMRQNSKLGRQSKFTNVNWFASGAVGPPFYIQDIIHIATKLRNFLLRTQWNLRSLPFGRGNYIQLKQLFQLLDMRFKGLHELTKSVLNPTDKQNFESVKKMYSEKVTDLLKSNVKNSEATVLFLKIMRDVTDAFLNRDLKPLERVKKMWYAVFILRLWRRYIVTHRNYSLETNFLTANCYSCIELNAHSLVQTILYLRNNNKPDLFLPHQLGSQQCEGIFRKLRSLTSTFSTVANVSTKEALARFSKIQMLDEIIHMTSPVFEYPQLGSSKNKPNKFELPSLFEIETEIEKCAEQAIETALRFNLINEYDEKEDFELLLCQIKPLSQRTRKNEKPKPIIIPKLLKLSDFDGIALKNFSATKNCVDENSPFLELFFDNHSKRIVVKKSSFCWLLRKDWHRLSSDRLRRVQCPTSYAIKQTISTRSRKRKNLIYPRKITNKQICID